jgi:hypothetical protein
MNYYITGGVAAVAFAAGFLVNGWRLNGEIANINAAHAAAVAQATADALEQTTLLQEKKDNALKQAQKAAAANADAAARARSELDWVRDYNSRTTVEVSSATCPSVRDHTAALAAVFGECSAALTDMAKKADGHALDVKTLIDAWPTNESNE